MYFEDIKVGDEFPVITKPEITRVQLVKYAGASGDFNPLHTVEEVAERSGTGIIAHGMLVMGMVAHGVTSWIPRKYVKKLSVRFKSMTYPGETIHIKGKVLEILPDEVIFGEVLALNIEGEIKLSGTFECKLPLKKN